MLARRLLREPVWRGWGTAAVLAAVAMADFLATFGVLISHGGPAGVFEKLASLTPTVFGIALTVRLSVAATPESGHPQATTEVGAGVR